MSPPLDDQNTELPVVLGRYQVVSLLGKGASASVYLCNDLRKSGMPVALKVFARTVLDSQSAKARIAQEIQLAHAIQHRNVIRLYDVVNHEQMIGFSMEYVAGQDLFSYLNKNHPLSLREILSISRQICQGLEAIHRIGVVHRDLKLENVIMNRDGVCKIADFGVSTVMNYMLDPANVEQFHHELEGQSYQRGSRVTQKGNIVGTLDYLAPEYLSQGKVTPQADIYALGVMLYELISGRSPFLGMTPAQLISCKLEKHPELTASGKETDCLVNICNKAMAFRAEQRFMTTSNLFASLNTVNASAPGPRSQKRSRSFKPLAYLLSFAGALGLVFGIFLLLALIYYLYLFLNRINLLYG